MSVIRAISMMPRKEQTMSEHDCNKCPYKRLCEEIEIKDLSCDDIKVIAQGSAEIGSLYEMCG